MIVLTWFLLSSRSILIGTGGGRLPTSPRLARVWVNRSTGISFEETSSVKGAQEWELLENENGSRGSVEYPVRISKFANVSELDLFFVSFHDFPFSFEAEPVAEDLLFSQANTRSEQTRLFYLGFMGESRQLKKEPGEPMTGKFCSLQYRAPVRLTDPIIQLTVGAENAAPSLLDGMKEEKRGANQTSAR